MRLAHNMDPDASYIVYYVSVVQEIKLDATWAQILGYHFRVCR
jgi:hypothetical protein